MNDLPLISEIPNRTIARGSTTGPIPFTIQDVETAADDLLLSVASSDTDLVPLANVSFSGAGTSRTVEVAPRPDAVGTASITITVSDGEEVATSTFVLTVSDDIPPPLNPRATAGLVVLYGFEEGAGTTVRDVGGVGSPMDLTILDPARVQWLGGGVNGVRFTSAGSGVRSSGAAAKLHSALGASGQVSLEAWVIPSSLTQSGPARIVTLSGGTASSQMNLHLGQGGASGAGDAASFRLRTSVNSFSWLQVGGVFGNTTDLRHVVLTYDGTMQRLYVDGVQQGVQALAGAFSNWNTTYPLVLGNESTLDRSWLGTLRLVALYDRALSLGEIQQNHAAGPSLGSAPAQAPVIQTQPMNATVTEPNPAAFSVVAGGTAPLSYQWRRGVVNIPGATSSSYTLSPTSVGADDGAEFSVVVSNASGSVTSVVAVLSVNAPGARVTSGLVVLYGFEEGTGTTVGDVSGVGTPMNLTVLDPARVQWLGGGNNGIRFLSSGSAVRSVGAATKIHGALTASSRVSLEAWVSPSSLAQSGPARIVTVSGGTASSQMNLHLGQGGATGLGEAASFRLRTTANSFAWLQAGNVFADTANARHLVLTYDGSAQRVYLDGVQHGTAQALTGMFNNWDASYPLVVGNEASLDRSWLGSIFLLAVYDRALTPAEVQQNFNAGPSLGSGGGKAGPGMALDLRVELRNEGLTVFWPLQSAGFILQETEQIDPGDNWMDVLEPVTAEGELNVVRLRPSGSQRFFRLRAP